jgi:predicted SnoaL-like aldol condensation-catalyzing enzyme
MKMKKGQLGFSAIHKHSYAFFLLSGLLASSKEDGIEEFIAPCYVISPRGAKRIVHAIEDCTIVTIHANPTNTQELRELEKMNVVFSWEEYEEYLKNKK